MIDDNYKEILEQRLMDAYCSIVVHQAYMAKIDKILTNVDLLSLCTPICVLVVQVSLLSIGYMGFTKFLSVLSALLSGALLVLAIVSLMKDYRNKLKQHQRFLVENYPIIDEIKRILLDPDSDIKDAIRIIDKTTALDKEESQLLSNIKDDERQNFYRLALIRTNDVNVVCPVCRKSPFKYKTSENKCHICGNKTD